MYDINHAAAELFLEPPDLQEIYSIFFQEMTTLMAGYEEKMAVADFVEMRQIMHAVKGMSANLRMNQLAQLARQAEQEIINQNISPLYDLLMEIQRETDELRQQINDFYLK